MQSSKGMAKVSEDALKVADKLLWKDLIVHYEKAYEIAMEKSSGAMPTGMVTST